MQCCPKGSRQYYTGKNPVQYILHNLWSIFGNFYFGLVNFFDSTRCCKCCSDIIQISPTLQKKNPGSTLTKKQDCIKTTCFYLIQNFFKKLRVLEIVSLPHFLHNLWRKTFVLLHSITWPNFIVRLPLLNET